MEPRIQYAQTKDGVSIAYAVLGVGPPLIGLAPWPASFEQDWENAEGRAFIQALAENRTFVTACKSKSCLCNETSSTSRCEANGYRVDGNDVEPRNGLHEGLAVSASEASRATHTSRASTCNSGPNDWNSLCHGANRGRSSLTR